MIVFIKDRMELDWRTAHIGMQFTHHNELFVIVDITENSYICEVAESAVA